MKKKMIFILFLLINVLVGCENKRNDEISVITTIFPIYDFVNEIKTDDINVNMLLKPGQEVHTYDPSAKDIISINECNLFIYIGGESDAWVEDIISSIDNEDFNALKLSDYVDMKHSEDEEEHDHEHEEYDEHIWTSPKNACLMVEAISKELKKITTNNAEIESNTEEYLSKLKQLDQDFKEAVLNAKTNIMVFGDRFPFLYFAEEYGLKCYKAFPGCSTETEASAKMIKELVEVIKENNLNYVFYIDLSNKNVCKTISEETGAQMLLFHSCQNVSLDEFNCGESYLSLMKNNLINLQRGLS